MFAEDIDSYKNYSYKYHGKGEPINLPNKEKLKNYFLKEKNEDDKEILSVYNYYYTSDEEKDCFGEIGEEKDGKNCKFGEFNFKIKFNYKDPRKFIME
jgi:hypothetical protein